VTYPTSQGTYFAFHDDGNAVTAYKIAATNPPGIVSAWSMGQGGRGSTWVTTTDGTNNAIVWVAGVQGDQRLHSYNADTGLVVYAGGGANELMTGTRQWNTGIATRGRIYFAADNKVYAFSLPTATPTPTPGQITLTARGYKVQGRHQIDLTWSGATSNTVDIYRNGTRIVTVMNNGAYTDSTGGHGHATYTYKGVQCRHLNLF
jgi:hypothetical protein